jgi:threonyl-tRNA synthetase
MIHRAILGSLERFLAIITENTGGRWPFWLAPRQVTIIPVAAPFKEYANSIQKKLQDLEFYAEVDNSPEVSGCEIYSRRQPLTKNQTLPKKIVAATLKQTPLVLVVGEDEEKNNAVNVRNRDDAAESKKRGEIIPLDTFIAKLQQLRETRAPIISLA